MIHENGHPFSQDSLEKFAAGTATCLERRGIVRHLLARCQECREGILRALRGGGPASAEEYQRAITVAFERAVAAMAAVTNPPPVDSRLAELDQQPPLRRETLVRNHPRYRSVEVLEALAQRGFSRRFSDYDAMLSDTRLAVILAEELDAHTSRADAAKVRAWCYYANAVRIIGRHDEAARAFAQTIVKLQKSEGARRLEAEVFEHMASLQTDERRFADANDLLERSAALYRDEKCRNELGRVLLKQAINLVYGCQPTLALDRLLEASPLIDAHSDPSLAISVVLTVVRCHLEENQPDQALNVFLLARDLFQVQREPLAVAKIWWTEGVLLMAHGHLEAAQNLLERVHQEFLSRSLHYHCALVSLDLALVLSQLGHFSEVRALISQSLPIFRALRVQRELLASIIMLTQVDRQESYVAIIREASRRLEREPGAMELQAQG